jgi:2-polyprenyl-3-methyl-5-hydroxy-6-metoxy-1,4-benzoquinol methylase
MNAFRDAAAANAYDRVRYPGAPQPSSHPAAMGALACLYGRGFASPSRCRVLEVGCGDGANLLSMAATSPQSRFIGFDLAETAIAHARATAVSAGLTNVEFSVMDIQDTSESLGEFDYIIAHGVYAWVPAPVRDALMLLIDRTLAPSGLAFVSYNAMPGSRVRQIVRDILLDHVRGITDVGEKFAAAKECMEFYAGAWAGENPLRNAMREEMLATLRRPPEVLFHDEMGEIFEPQFVSHVSAHAKKHGLQYLCDSSPALNSEAFFPSEETSGLRKRANGDWVRYEQLHDYVKLQGFRRTIFCRDDGVIDRRAEWTRLQQLHAHGRFHRESAKKPNSDAFVFRTDRGEAGKAVSTTNANLAALIGRIGASDPGAIPLESAITNPGIGEAVLRLFLAGSLSLQTEPFRFTLTPGKCPTATALARVQASRGETRFSTLRHTVVEITDPASRHLITLLDGTRTRRQLASEMARFTRAPPVAAAGQVDGILTGLARLALLAG